MEVKRLKHLMLTLDANQCPEAVEYFKDREGKDEISSYELASDLVNCDKDKVMPPELFWFIVSLYEESISNGNVAAMNDLGALYYDGRGCCQNFEKAIYYYKMAAEHGDAQAVENLGYCYYYGRSIPVDYEKAFQCFAKGAFAGRLISLYKIGDMYRKGYYVEKDSKEAFRIYSHCRELMHYSEEDYIAGPVFLRLGYMYLDGEGTEQDLYLALRFLQKSERYLYGMVANGDVMYMGSLKAAISGQERARSELAKKLPSRMWR